MPIVILIIGLALVISSFRGTNKELGALVKGDFTGPNNFAAWLFAIVAVGALGYIPTIKPLSNAFLVLIAIVIVLAHNTFISQVSTVLKGE